MYVGSVIMEPAGRHTLLLETAIRPIAAARNGSTAMVRGQPDAFPGRHLPVSPTIYKCLSQM